MKKSDEFLGTGRRKTSVARVRLSKGSGKIVVNDRAIAEYNQSESWINEATAPLKTVEMKDSVDVSVNVKGGGNSGQSGAIAHGIARALQSMDGELRSALKKQGHLTRDSRMKERKKSGQPGARKRFQFSKR
ncbi:MAG: 30S ribosomal protein S9 [Verrucomicrobia bacterium GWF2_51_19]|nr:MAG: 30S ribosomal protein S9 [Verrucomicrobia bacterium GWF2_51_19]HCJ12133.1 30S ribosomal protein S9 [Opitutae bacterium]